MVSYRCRTDTEGKDMADVMTNEQFETILEMIRMILDGCDDIESAKQKIDALIKKANKKD